MLAARKRNYVTTSSQPRLNHAPPRGLQVTQRFLDSAVLAKQQVQERCGGYHRVLYSVHEDVRNASSPKARAVASDLRRLRAALGEDGVITFGIHGAWAYVVGCTRTPSPAVGLDLHIHTCGRCRDLHACASAAPKMQQPTVLPPP